MDAIYKKNTINPLNTNTLYLLPDTITWKDNNELNFFIIYIFVIGSNALTEEPDGFSTTTAYIITIISFLIAMLIFRWLLNLLRKFIYYLFGLDSTFRNSYTAENKSTDDF